MRLRLEGQGIIVAGVKCHAVPLLGVEQVEVKVVSCLNHGVSQRQPFSFAQFMREAQNLVIGSVVDIGRVDEAGGCWYNRGGHGKPSFPCGLGRSVRTSHRAAVLFDENMIAYLGYIVKWLFVRLYRQIQAVDIDT